MSLRISPKQLQLEQLQLPGFDGVASFGLDRLRVSADLLVTERITVRDAAEFVARHASTHALLAESSLRTFAPIWFAFARYLAIAQGVDELKEVSPHDVDRFLRAPTKAGRAPGAATMHSRRAAIRCLFRIARTTGIAAQDPTYALELPVRRSERARPMTDEEIQRCRLAASAGLSATREPAAWALAETGASTMEIGSVRPHQVRLDSGTVDLGPGTSRHRTGELSAWGVKQLRRRLEAAGSEWVLTESATSSPDGRRTRATELIRNVLTRAGVAGPGVTVRSVAGWRGQHVYAATKSVPEVALALGLRSLDQAAELIALDWRRDE